MGKQEIKWTVPEYKKPAERVDAICTLLMGDKVEPRREYIQYGANSTERRLLDARLEKVYALRIDHAPEWKHRPSLFGAGGFSCAIRV